MTSPDRCYAPSASSTPRTEGLITPTELTHRLRVRAERADARPPTYAQVAARVRDGAIPAEWHGKGWWIKPEDEARAAELFGLRAGPGPRRVA